MCCVFFSGLVHSVFLAGYISLTLAGPIQNAPEIDLSTALTEGSGKGSLLDVLAGTDDDTSDDDYNNAVWGFYDSVDGAGGGVDDGGGVIQRNVLIPKVAVEDSTAGLDSLKVTCFHCHGDGINGCDVETMLDDVQTFSITCFGKCLNLSSGSIAVYDCAYDMVTKLDTCLKNGDTQMCFCTGDFCNGPSENDTFYHRQKTPYFSHQQSQSQNLALDDHGNGNIDATINLDNKSRKHDNNVRKEAKTERLGKNYKNRSTFTESKSHIKDSGIEHTTDNQMLQSEISTEFRRHESVSVPRGHKTHMNVVISHTDSSITDNSTSTDVVIPNAFRLRGSTLESRADMKYANTGPVVLTISNSAVMLILLLVIPCSL